MEVNFKNNLKPEEKVTIQNDFGNNVGEIFNEGVLTSGEGKKLIEERAKLDYAKNLLDKLKYEDTIEESKDKLSTFLGSLYHGSKLTDKVAYMLKIRETSKVISFGYNILISKELFYQKRSDNFEDEMKGI